MAIAFTIPLAKKFVPGFIVLLCLYSIYFFALERRFHLQKKHSALVLLFGIFLLHLLGIAYSTHTPDAWNEVGIKMSYLVFPLLGLLIPTIKQSDNKSILWTFVWGCLAFVVLAVSYGLYRSHQFQDSSYLSYEKLGIFLHPTYAATYLAMAIFILLRFATHSEYLIKRAWTSYVAVLAMLIFICMLASKAGFIAALISILMAMWVWFKNFKSIARALTMAVLCIGIMAASIKLLPVSAERVSNAIVDAHNTSAPSGNEKKEAHSSTELRMVTWSAAGTLLLEHPLGVGTGDTESELINKYVQANENYAAERKLNAHNQFLQAGAEHGWLGILLLIACMLVLTYNALKWQNIVMLNFVLLCGMNFLFESFLEVQAGLVFFGFFVFVFVKSEQNT